MANLYEAINQILGPKGQTVGIRYYVNHSTGEEPGDTAVWPLVIKRKVEGYPPMPSENPENDFPGVYFSLVGGMPVARLMGKVYEVQFNIAVYYVTKVEVGKTARETAREYITKVADNIMASNKLGLDCVSSLQWNGFEESRITEMFSFYHPDYCCALSRFVVTGVVEW